MSALRRDLFERRLWPLVALLLAALVAVPLLLLKHAPVSGARALAPPNVVIPGLPAASVVAASAAPTLPGGVPRDPFASGMPKLASKPAASLASASSPASTQATLVTPSPAASSSQSPATTSTSATGSGSPQGTGSAAASTTTSSVPTLATKATSQPSTKSWTIYAADLRFGKDTKAAVQLDLARLTLLPSPKQPELMFMGVVAGGRQAVFALAAGVQHTGPGLCQPRRQRCSAILLRAGQTERITVPTPSGGQQRTILRLVRVRSRVTRSRSVALAAYKRQSAAGRCDLYLAEPMSYSQSEGTLSAATGGSCRHQPAAVPFPSAVTTQ